MNLPRSSSRPVMRPMASSPSTRLITSWLLSLKTPATSSSATILRVRRWSMNSWSMPWLSCRSSSAWAPPSDVSNMSFHLSNSSSSFFFISSSWRFSSSSALALSSALAFSAARRSSSRSASFSCRRFLSSAMASCAARRSSLASILAAFFLPSFLPPAPPRPSSPSSPDPSESSSEPPPPAWRRARILAMTFRRCAGPPATTCGASRGAAAGASKLS
mmetsp:Transcript_9378/g.26907  ORF Transcript_9378/g.26907 Transcript_9378/m.26907 type:complete len:218 (+) Transcript_9378:172-825(+)